MKDQIEAMKKWCLEHYEQGADTMAECWSDEDYANLFTSIDGEPLTAEQAWNSLKQLADIYQDQQADARNSAF
jgi:hypothetical protein